MGGVHERGTVMRFEIVSREIGAPSGSQWTVAGKADSYDEAYACRARLDALKDGNEYKIRRKA